MKYYCCDFVKILLVKVLIFFCKFVTCSVYLSLALACSKKALIIQHQQNDRTLKKISMPSANNEEIDVIFFNESVQMLLFL